VHGPLKRVHRPGGDLGLREPEDLPRRRVRPQHGPVCGVVDDALRHGLEHAAEPLLGRGQPGRGFLQCAPGLDVGGHIGGAQQDACDIPVGVANRLVDVIQEQVLLGRPTAIEPEPRLAAADGLPGGHDPVEYLHLVVQFRHDLTQRFAEHVPAADQLGAGVVDEIHDQIGPGQVGHDGGQAREQFSHECEPIWRGVTAWDRNRDLRTPPRVALNICLVQDISRDQSLCC
jgi:hypothetical protein